MGENLDPEFPDRTMAVLLASFSLMGAPFFEQRLDVGPEDGFFDGVVRHLTH